MNLHDILHDARQSREFMGDTPVILTERIADSLKRGKEHSAERVPQSGSITRIAPENLKLAMVFTE
jgi:hypothetical protein